ncbi:methionine--tRNA ligase [Orientia chuto str. Dubai]|uniref:Methionine--tRNA ligase n=1 Tax=Orientia chuto str. Dubai TaxID=1359168 RepID=A0A0F3MSA9_9RICK|nr:methionine--tRNA ligase [Candidatus Orientia mediorientalis]KJV57499.1 methionine--tRNA ligase [Orientia chuto str. Dubai]
MKNKYYITTPIYYVNDIPHIGHAYTSIIADVYARFMRLLGKEVIFLTGTDEHGQKVEKAASSAGILPQEFVDKIASSFIKLSIDLNLSNNDFIRTTEIRHVKAVQKFWNILNQRGDIYLGKYCGWYSIKDEAFYSEAELTADGKAPTGTEVEWVEESSYFFTLSKWQQKLLHWYENNDNIIKPAFFRNEVINFIKNGLTDLSISRTTFKWGIAVPNDPLHVIYVWLDALVNYVSALEYASDNSTLMANFWPANLHIVGKDILRFHAVYWPAFLMSADLPLPKTILVHGWWTNEGQKISKSVGNVINPVDLVNKFGVDQVRYFLLKEITVGKDGNFSQSGFINRINSELCNKLGNLVHRTLSFIYKYNKAKIPLLDEINIIDLYKSEPLLINTVTLSNSLVSLINNENITIILSKIMEIVNQANMYFDQQAPWKFKDSNAQKVAKILYTLIETIRGIAILLQPFIPESASKILDLIAVDKTERKFNYIDSSYALKPGKVISEPIPIFVKIEEKSNNIC